MKLHHYILLVLCVSMVLSCTPKKKKSHIPYIDYSTEYVGDSETIDVPFTVERGVKYITAKINGLSTDMIFDTGCSGVLISPLEVQQLIKRGLLSEEDFIGTSQAIIADGSVVEEAMIIIRTMELTDGKDIIVCNNVLTQVSSNIEAPVLLGNGVLDRTASFTIDNEQNVIKIKIK